MKIIWTPWQSYWFHENLMGSIKQFYDSIKQYWFHYILIDSVQCHGFQTNLYDSMQIIGLYGNLADFVIILQIQQILQIPLKSCRCNGNLNDSIKLLLIP